MKKSMFKVFGLLLLGATLTVSCDDDGLTAGDSDYWTTSRGQFTAKLEDGTTMYFLDQKDGTAAVTFDGSNPNHWTSSTTVTPKVTTYVGAVTVPETITADGKTYKINAIGDEAFMACTTMTSCTLPESVTSFGEGAFCLCKTMTSVNIPEAITDIPSACFGQCVKLTTISIPAGVKTIGRTAFYNCNGLKTIQSNATVPPTVKDSTSFYSVTATVIVPAGSKAAYESADYWKNLTIQEQ